MYFQFSFIERSKLHDALKVLNSEQDDRKYQEALSSALQVLNNSQAYEGSKVEWAVEVISAYREIGKSLVKHMNFGLQLYPEELLSFKKEFGEFLEEYSGEETLEKMRTILQDLEMIDSEQLSGDKSQTLTSRLKMTLNDFASVFGIMNQYELKDSSDLYTALREREELKEKVDKFESSF